MIRYSQCTGQLSMTASFETRVDYAKKTINGNVRLKEKHIDVSLFGNSPSKFRISDYFADK